MLLSITPEDIHKMAARGMICGLSLQRVRELIIYSSEFTPNQFKDSLRFFLASNTYFR